MVVGVDDRARRLDDTFYFYIICAGGDGAAKKTIRQLIFRSALDKGFSVTNQLHKSVHLTNYYHKNSGGISTSYNNLLAAAPRHERFISLIVPGEREETEQVNDYAKIYYVPAKKSPVFD